MWCLLAKCSYITNNFTHSLKIWSMTPWYNGGLTTLLTWLYVVQYLEWNSPTAQMHCFVCASCVASITCTILTLHLLHAQFWLWLTAYPCVLVFWYRCAWYLTLIYLTLWISFLLKQWDIQFLPPTSLMFMSIICIWFTYVCLSLRFRHSSFQWYMTCLDSKLFYPSAIRFKFSTLKILKIGWVN